MATPIENNTAALNSLLDKANALPDGGGGAVLYTPQELTDEQKAQARANIGAANASDIDTAVSQISKEKADKEFVVSIFEQLKALIEAGKTDEAIAVLDEAILDLAVLA